MQKAKWAYPASLLLTAYNSTFNGGTDVGFSTTRRTLRHFLKFTKAILSLILLVLEIIRRFKNL